MAVDVVKICNAALTRLGADPITSLNEDNDRALLCDSNYEIARDSVLEDFPWHFAIKRKTLAKSATAPVFGWSSAFPVPPDSLRVLETDDETLKWAEEDGFILSNRDSMKIRYIAKVADINKFSPTFVDALAERLAAEIAYGVTGKRSVQLDKLASYKEKIQNAETSSSQIGTPRVLEDDTLLVVRGAGSEPPLAKEQV